MILAACAALAVGVAGPAEAIPATDIRKVAFAGAVYLAEPGETADLAGNLHLVTRLGGSEQTGWTLDWRANLDTTTATGQSTATHYVGSGADTGTVAFPPSPRSGRR